MIMNEGTKQIENRNRRDIKGDPTDSELKEALDTAIAVWEELAESGLNVKWSVSSELWEKIKNDLCNCPLCTIFISEPTICEGCPLSEMGDCCLQCHSSYYKWVEAFELVQIKNHARNLLDSLKTYRERM